MSSNVSPLSVAILDSVQTQALAELKVLPAVLEDTVEEARQLAATVGLQFSETRTSHGVKVKALRGDLPAWQIKILPAD